VPAILFGLSALLDEGAVFFDGRRPRVMVPCRGFERCFSVFNSALTALPPFCAQRFLLAPRDFALSLLLLIR
jgi:hypothetical protein